LTQSEFIEKEFETAFNCEFLDRYGGDLQNFPYIPSTIAEREDGYDINYERIYGKRVHSYFLQFKRPYLYKRRPSNCDLLISHPLFGFALHKGETPDSYNQHNRLVRRSTNQSQSASVIVVRYVSPIFHSKRALFSLFKRKLIIRNSAAIDPASIGIISNLDQQQHRVYYTRNDPFFIFCSDTKKIEYNRLDAEFKKTNPYLFDQEYLFKVYKELQYMITGSEEENPDLIPKRMEDYHSVFRIAYLAKRYLKLNWYIIPEENFNAVEERSPITSERQGKKEVNVTG
jgi:hypothetical protein